MHGAIYIYIYIRRASGPQPSKVVVQALLYYNNESLELCIRGMPGTTSGRPENHNFSNQCSRALKIEEKYFQGPT